MKLPRVGLLQAASPLRWQPSALGYERRGRRPDVCAWCQAACRGLRQGRRRGKGECKACEQLPWLFTCCVVDACRWMHQHKCTGYLACLARRVQRGWPHLPQFPAETLSLEWGGWRARGSVSRHCRGAGGGPSLGRPLAACPPWWRCPYGGSEGKTLPPPEGRAVAAARGAGSWGPPAGRSGPRETESLH